MKVLGGDGTKVHSQIWCGEGDSSRRQESRTGCAQPKFLRFSPALLQSLTSRSHPILHPASRGRRMPQQSLRSFLDQTFRPMVSLLGCLVLHRHGIDCQVRTHRERIIQISTFKPSGTGALVTVVRACSRDCRCHLPRSV